MGKKLPVITFEEMQWLHTEHGYTALCRAGQLVDILDVNDTPANPIDIKKLLEKRYLKSGCKCPAKIGKYGSFKTKNDSSG